MNYLHRDLEDQVARAARNFPAVVLTGPRRAGKTMLLRRLFPKASYFLLEDPDVVARLRADPHGFLDAVKTPALPVICWASTRPPSWPSRHFTVRCSRGLSRRKW